MLGLDPLVLSGVLVLAGSPNCPAHEPTQINVVPRTEDVKYDYKQSLKQVQGYGTDTVDPYSFHGTSITQAFMQGQIQTRYKMSFAHVVQNGYACMWYKDITVHIDIDPTIVIASEIYRDQCMKRAVLDHELKHVRVDREVVNKYAKQIGTKLMTELRSRGFEAGPFASSRLPDVKSKMERVVSQILELEFQKLSIERQERQRSVDSLEEYESVGAKCPLFEKKKRENYAKWLQ